MSDKAKGRARMLVSDDIVKCAPAEIRKPVYGQITWHVVEVKELFDIFQSFLLLPQQYGIVGVFFDVSFALWTLLVESEDIPPPQQNKEIPILMPSYYIENGVVHVDKLSLL